MAQGPMDHDRIGNVEKALDEHKELTREQFREILKRMDAGQVQADAKFERQLTRMIGSIRYLMDSSVCPAKTH